MLEAAQRIKTEDLVPRLRVENVLRPLTNDGQNRQELTRRNARRLQRRVASTNQPWRSMDKHLRLRRKHHTMVIQVVITPSQNVVLPLLSESSSVVLKKSFL